MAVVPEENIAMPSHTRTRSSAAVPPAPPPLLAASSSVGSIVASSAVRVRALTTGVPFDDGDVPPPPPPLGTQASAGATSPVSDSAASAAAVDKVHAAAEVCVSDHCNLGIVSCFDNRLMHLAD